MLPLLIASPYPAMRAGLRALVGNAALVVAEADTVELCIEWARVAQPEVILYDLALEGDDDLRGLWRLRAQAPAAEVLALTEPNGNARVLAALRAGARGCVYKTVTNIELIESLKSIAAGETVLPPSSSSAFLDDFHATTPLPHIEPLSPRETEVLREVAIGLTNKAIGQKLGISEHTVKFHLGSAMSKLGAASRAEAVATAIRRGLISI